MQKAKRVRIRIKVNHITLTAARKGLFLESTVILYARAEFKGKFKFESETLTNHTNKNFLKRID